METITIYLETKTREAEKTTTTEITTRGKLYDKFINIIFSNFTVYDWQVYPEVRIKAYINK